MQAMGSGEATGVMTQLLTKVGAYRCCGMRRSANTSGMTTRCKCWIAHPEMQAPIGNTPLFQSGPTASSST